MSAALCSTNAAVSAMTSGASVSLPVDDLNMFTLDDTIRVVGVLAKTKLDGTAYTSEDSLVPDLVLCVCGKDSTTNLPTVYAVNGTMDSSTKQPILVSDIPAGITFARMGKTYFYINNETLMASIKVKLRRSSVENKEGTLFYQIIHLRQVRQIYTELHIRDEEWDGENSSVITQILEWQRIKYLTAIKESLMDGYNRLKAIISQFEDKGFSYTVDDIVIAFNAPITVAGVVPFFRKLICDMNKIGKKSMANRLELSLKSLLRYTGGGEVAWSDLTSTFVLGYEEFLMRRGLCRNSTSFYMRNLRSVVKRAIDQDYEVPRNPFKHVYMGIDKTVKRAISLDTVCKIRDLDLAGCPSLDFARKVFMFSFYTRGMSFVDIAFLKKRDVSNGMITYSRRKTRQQLCVRIEPATQKIIDSFGQSGSVYLLPILSDSAEYVEERQYVNAYNRINLNIQKVGKMLGVETKLTLYVARHAWASIAHTNNVPLSTISRALGHDSESTTQIYLQSLDTTSVDKANRDIIRMMNDIRTTDVL